MSCLFHISKRCNQIKLLCSNCLIALVVIRYKFIVEICFQNFLNVSVTCIIINCLMCGARSDCLHVQHVDYHLYVNMIKVIIYIFQKELLLYNIIIYGLLLRKVLNIVTLYFSYFYIHDYIQYSGCLQSHNMTYSMHVKLSLYN